MQIGVEAKLFALVLFLITISQLINCFQYPKFVRNQFHTYSVPNINENNESINENNQFIRNPNVNSIDNEVLEILNIKNSELEDSDEIDINLVGEETGLDQSIAMAVKQFTDDGPREPQPEPLDVLKDFLKNVKTKTNNATADNVLSRLFTDKPTTDPFDDRKVMFKFRNILAPEDFKSVFEDPTVGDWL